MQDMEAYKTILETAERESKEGDGLTVERWRELRDDAIGDLGERPDLLEALAVYYPGGDDGV